MRVVRETDTGAFYVRVGEFLLRHEVEHNVVLGQLETHTRGLMKTPFVYMAYAEHEGEVAAVSTRLGNHLYSISRAADLRAIKALVYDAAADAPDTSGVFGPKEEADRFAGVWCVRTGQTTSLNRAERIYRLDAVIPARPTTGSPRPMTEADEKWALDWWIAFMRVADPHMGEVPRETLANQIRARFIGPDDVRGLWVWEVDGVPVSMAGYQGPTLNTIRLGPVYTPPETRGHGYASALCAVLSQWLLDSGRQAVTLFTDLANPTANHIYQTIGYTPVCDASQHSFRAEETA